MSVAVAESYQYLPITDHDGIRLIVLRPSPDEAAAIQCEIIHTTLQQAQIDIYDHYTALSYVWGNADDMTTISVDGRPLRITASLECALRHLRGSKRTVNIWADGVCNNQKDVAEKGRQVQQMGKVYENATHTVIFLGKGEPAAQALLSTVLSSTSSTKQSTDYDVDNIETIKALHSLLQSEWFYRVWIFQELVLSKDPMIQYGHIRLPWNVFCTFTYYVKNMDSLRNLELEVPKSLSSKRTPSLQYELSLPQRIDVVGQMNAARFRVTKSSLEKVFEVPSGNLQPLVTTEVIFRQLLDILTSRRGFGTTDPRDMIFAHLGLIDMPIVEVNYEKTFAQVFEMFVKQYITATRDFDIFAYTEDFELEKRRSELATWAVDWTSRSSSAGSRHKYLIHTVDPYNPRNSWSMDRDPRPHFSDTDHKAVQTRAGLVATVGNLSGTLDTSSYVPYCARMLDSDGTNLEDAAPKIWVESLAAKCARSWLREQLNRDQKVFSTFSASLDTRLYFGPFTSFADYLLQEIEGSASSGESIIDGRRLATCECYGYSYLALVPASTKIGDLVYFLEVWYDPFVFRRRKECRGDGLGSDPFCVNLIGKCLLDWPLLEQHRSAVRFYYQNENFGEGGLYPQRLSIH